MSVEAFDKTPEGVPEFDQKTQIWIQSLHLLTMRLEQVVLEVCVLVFWLVKWESFYRTNNSVASPWWCDDLSEEKEAA